MKEERLLHGARSITQFGTWLRAGVVRPLGSARAPVERRAVSVMVRQ